MTNFPFAGKIHRTRRSIHKSEADDLGIAPDEAPYAAHNYINMNGRITVAALLSYLEEHAPRIPLDDIGIDWFSLVWVDDATAEERADYDRRAARSTQNRIDWERKTLAKLLEKYPDAHQPTTAETSAP